MIHRSPLPLLDLPKVALSGFVLPKQGALAHKLALIDVSSGRSLTYAQLWGAVRRLARGLAALGFGRGDVLALYAPNALEYPLAFHAAALLGGATTTINPLYTEHEAKKQLLDSGAVLLVSVPQLADKARAAAAGTAVRELLILGEASFERLLAAREWEAQVELDPEHQVVALPYSSGTTGLPKGVQLTHANLVANVAQLAATGLMRESDTLLCVLPMFHIYGITAILAQGLHLGCTIAVLPRFDFETLLRALQDQRISFAHLVPPLVLKLAKDPLVERYDLGAMHTIFSGAAPLSAELTQACEARLGCRITQGYGMTESSPATHSSPAERARSKPGSAGVLVPNTECVVVDARDGHSLPPGATGELWVRGPQIMRGYLNAPEASAATLDAQGWLHTGDLCRVDADGQLFVVDRLKELIKVKGQQVAPAELEALLFTHPAVADAAVIGVPDEEAGERPKAFIVLRAALQAGELLAFLAPQLAPHKRIAHFEFVREIPKSPSGKILRRVLVERERAPRG